MGAAGGAAQPTGEDGNGSTSALADRDVLAAEAGCVALRAEARAQRRCTRGAAPAGADAVPAGARPQRPRYSLR
jgi:hypothetical protein